MLNVRFKSVVTASIATLTALSAAASSIAFAQVTPLDTIVAIVDEDIILASEVRDRVKQVKSSAEQQDIPLPDDETVVQETHIIKFSKEGYLTIEGTFLPDNVGLDPVTMKPGNGTADPHNDEQAISGWTLDDAVSLSTAVGLLTLGTALLGVQAAVEIRRGKRYRRSQYLAAGALFSRGLIIVGPTLILFGMIVNLFAKEDFEDERED